MNPVMAIQTAPSDELVVPRSAKALFRVVRGARMPAEIMTILTEVRELLGQEVKMLAAVRVMAGHAVFLDRRMFENKRSAFVSVATVTKLVIRLGPDHSVRQGSMRVMTINAGHFSFENRMVRKTIHL